jgi:hypothetical protein
LCQRRRSRPVPLPRQRPEPAETMRFSRFPRVEQPTRPSARRVAAARRAVQAEQDRYPLFPQLVTHHTPEARLAAIDKHRVEWWQEQRDFRADRWRKARASARTSQRNHSLLATWIPPRRSDVFARTYPRPQSEKALFLARTCRASPAQIDFGRPPS